MGDLVFTAGQGGFGADGEVVDGGFDAQLRQTFANLDAALQRAGSSLDGIVKLTAFLVNPEDYAAWRRVRAEFITPPYPRARPSRRRCSCPGCWSRSRPSPSAAPPARSAPNPYPNVLRPIELGPVELRNRVVSTSHQTSLVHDHVPTEDLVAYQEARARGGVGGVFLEATAVHPTGL